MQPSSSDIEYIARHVLKRQADAGTLADILPQMDRFSRQVLVPLGRSADVEGCTLDAGGVRLPAGFKQAYARYAADGWVGLSLPPRFGGMGLSNLVQAAVSEQVNGACLAFGMVALTARAAASTLIAHADGELRDDVVAKICRGECTGTIAMTEPGAGSDASLITTRAVPIDGSRYAVTGSKMFISFADHDLAPQIMHLVLARTPQHGAKLSLFAVPKWHPTRTRELGPQVQIVGIERKLGLHGSPTCAVEFRDSEGVLVGQLGEGLKAIFTMVNTMRLEVAVEGVGLAHAACEAAWQYATQRIQGRGPDGSHVAIVRHPDVRRMLVEMCCRTEGARALVLQTAAFMDEAEGLTGAEAAGMASLVGFLLPICKAAASEIAVGVTNAGVQVHGGSGYTQAFAAERFLRDARILPIYEGTNGIQAIDLVMRKVRRDPGAFERLLGLISRTASTQEGPADLRQALHTSTEGLRRATETLLRHDDEAALSVASDYLRLISDVAIGWMWVRMASARDTDAQRLKWKLMLARMHVSRHLARGTYLVERIGSGSANAPDVGDFL
jgi:alkylation response protein AidB-like acyl-CoA dehydrogenase